MFMSRITLPDTVPSGATTERMARIPAIPFTDEHGQECLRVPLDRQGRQFAIVDSAAYQRVRDAGATGAWLANSNGQGRSYVRAWVPTGVGTGTLVQVARLIVGAGAKTVVRYANGDTLDLRGRNLSWQRGKAKRNDAELADNARLIRGRKAMQVTA